MAPLNALETPSSIRQPSISPPQDEAPAPTQTPVTLRLAAATYINSPTVLYRYCDNSCILVMSSKRRRNRVWHHIKRSMRKIKNIPDLEKLKNIWIIYTYKCVLTQYCFKRFWCADFVPWCQDVFEFSNTNCHTWRLDIEPKPILRNQKVHKTLLYLKNKWNFLVNWLENLKKNYTFVTDVRQSLESLFRGFLHRKNILSFFTNVVPFRFTLLITIST